jgi:hypothetical protein
MSATKAGSWRILTIVPQSGDEGAWCKKMEDGQSFASNPGFKLFWPFGLPKETPNEARRGT